MISENNSAQTSISTNRICGLKKTIQEKHSYIFSSDLRLPLKRVRGQNRKELSSVCVEHSVSSVLLGDQSSLATVGKKPANYGTIKLPIIIHQVLRILLSTFRSSA